MATDRPAPGKVGDILSKEAIHSFDRQLESIKNNVDNIRRALAEKKMPAAEPQELRKFITFITNSEFQKVITPLFGLEFFDLLRMAPWEYALITLVGHLMMIAPFAFMEYDIYLKEKLTVQYWMGFIKVWKAMYDALYHGLTSSLLAANTTECEFKNLKSSSWHGIVNIYADKAIESVEIGLETGSKNHILIMKQPDWRKFTKKNYMNFYGNKLNYAQRKKFIMSDIKLKSFSKAIFQFLGVRNKLKENALIPTDNVLKELENDWKGLSIRLQQELPRAWAFKYGQGDTNFFKFDEADILLLESCVIPERAVGPRNALFQKWKEEEGLGPNRITKKWNAIPLDKRRQIAPKAPGNVSKDQVKKALQRDQKGKT
jgi:hypothetical protein